MVAGSIAKEIESTMEYFTTEDMTWHEGLFSS